MFLFTLRFHDKLMRQLNSHVFWSFFICDKCIRFNIIKFIFFNIGLSVFSYINQITYVFGAYHLTFFCFLLPREFKSSRQSSWNVYMSCLSCLRPWQLTRTAWPYWLSQLRWRSCSSSESRSLWKAMWRFQPTWSNLWMTLCPLAAKWAHPWNCHRDCNPKLAFWLLGNRSSKSKC